MKNITLSAPEESIARAREAMSAQGRTLNDAFREWLEGLAKAQRSKAFREFLETSRLTIESAGPYSRDEMNERR